MINLFKTNRLLNITLAMFVVCMFSIKTLVAQTPFESNNTTSDNSSAQMPESSSNDKLWGDYESPHFNNAQKAGTRLNAPALPDEPGATCVPVPQGTLMLLAMAFIYGLVVIYKTKRTKEQN